MMSTPLSATPLSRSLALSCFLLGFSATAYGADDLSFFKALPQPISLPAAIIDCPNRPPTPLADLIKHKAQGKPLLLHLWAPFCPPCRTEMREIDAAKPMVEKSPYALLTLGLDAEGAVSVPAFATRYSLKNKDLCYDRTQQVFHALGLRGLPVTALVNPAGQITALHEGSLTWSPLPAQEKKE